MFSGLRALSVARAREILGDEARELSDEQVQQLIAQIEAITDLMQEPDFGSPGRSLPRDRSD